MSDAKLTAEQLRELRDANPVAHARYVMANGGAAALSPEAERIDPHADPRATYEALKAQNPVAAARFAIENRLFEK